MSLFMLDGTAPGGNAGAGRGGHAEADATGSTEARAQGPSLEVVLPVRNMAEDLRAALGLIMSQLGPNDVATVVDDGSSDGTADVARSLGANVIRLDASVGPYAARHLAVSRSSADAIVFVDGRSRSRPGLLDSHRRLLADTEVALSCSPIVIESAPSLAARVAEVQDLFSLKAFIGIPGRLDYYPTANLGVRRTAYLSVGGFRKIRSGGDADLCWRIQLAGLGRLAVDDHVYMSWVPRRRIRGLIEQWYRYGQSAALLDELYPSAKAAPAPRDGRLTSVRKLVLALLTRPRSAPVSLVSGFTHSVFQLSYALASRSRRAQGPSSAADSMPMASG
ncbi:glycosyltransferase [Jatrophihabitans telluris]|uniref:Glycosyltransferase n=1 Tax=Jatrophihabitans telluris TaxID=2038343 RepID=A0ABY4QWN2_9ACTN|nr:glycosyltransferase [Jatrophihabitans telluris]UQX87878.1 glycosyltransferase [Jatrophihabitans telluris]